MTHDSESESETAVRACRRAVGLPETLENVWQKLRRDAWSRVAHADLHVTVILIDTNADSPADRRKLRSVRQQIPHDLLQPINVARDHLETFLKLLLDTDVFGF